MLLDLNTPTENLPANPACESVVRVHARPNRFVHWRAYALALALPLVLIGARFAMGYHAGDPPMLILFLTPPLVCAYLGGLWPGLVATGVTALLTNLFLLAPHYSFSLFTGLRSPQWLMLVLLGALVSVLFDALRKAGRRYQSIIDSSLDAVVVVDFAGRIAEFSPAAERMFGHRAAAVRGRELCAVVVPPEWQQRCREELAGCLAGDTNRTTAQRIEQTALRADGSEFPVEISLQRAGGAEPGLLTAFIRDLTDRRRAEEAIRKSEENYRDLVENSHDLICTHDLDGNLLSVNGAATDLTGYFREKLLTMNLRDLLAPERRPGLTFYLKEVRAKGHSRGLMKIQTATGETRFWEFENTLRPEGMIVRGIAHDITERRASEKALRESEERLRAVFEQAPLGIAEGEIGSERFLHLNQRYADIVGYTVEDLRTMTFRDFTHPDDLAADLEPLGRLLAGEISAYAIEKRFVRKDGSIVWVNLSVAAFAQATGRPRRTMAMIEDITERKRLEEQFRQSQKMEAVGQLSGGIAHDFNNLITVIKGRVGLLQQSRLPDADQMESVREIGQAAERAAALTRQLLAFSRRQVMQQQDLDLNALVLNMVKMLRRLLGEDVEIRLAFSATPLWTHADAALLEQVLLNLAVNARDAMPRGGVLTIGTTVATIDKPHADLWPQAAPGNFTRLTVSDTGTGIAPEIMSKIFEPFFTTKEVGVGTGLGLATVYGILQQHRGGIDVTSTVGRGSTFSVYLPQCAEPAMSVPASPAPVVRGGTETILVVEDEPAVLRVARLVLEHMGYRVLVADSGVEALAVWRENRATIKLLLTDLVMPDGMNGHELARELKRDQPRLRVIFSSGYSASVAGKDFPLDEATNFLAKPYEIEQLTAIVRKSLDTPTSAHPFKWTD